MAIVGICAGMGRELTWDEHICFAWHGIDRTSLIVVVNYAPGQCCLHLLFEELTGKAIRLRDLMNSAGTTGTAMRSYCVAYMWICPRGGTMFELATVAASS